MDETSNDQYTSPEGDLGQDIEFDFDDDEFDEDNDLMRILGLAGGIAVVVGGLIILRGRRRPKTPAEQMAEQASATVEDLRTTWEKADLGGQLNAALAQANARLRGTDVRDLARNAQQAAANADLEGALGEIQQRLGTIEREGRQGARRAQREARKAFNNLDLGDLSGDLRGQLTDLWEQITDRAAEVGWQEAIDESRRNIRKLSRDIRRQARNADTRDLAALLGAVAGSLGTLGSRVPSEDVLPEARKRARQAGETLSTIADQARKRGSDLADEYGPQVQAAAEQARKRGSDLADEYGPQVKKQAGKAAETAGSFSGQVADLLRSVALDALNRMMSDLLPAARKGGEQAAGTLRDDTLPWIRHRAGEVRDRVQQDVAPKVAEVASSAPGKAREAVGTAAPVVGEALGTAAGAVGGAVGDAVSRVRPKAGDAASSVGDAVRSGSSGVGGALSAVGQRTGDAVGATLDTTRYVTGETGRILFWLSMLSGLLLMVFVPDPERQREIWNNVQQFLGEMRNMWGDLTGDEFEAEADQDYTGDAGV